MKDDYEKLLKTREENKLKPQYTVEAKVELLIEYATQNGRPPSKKETYKDFNVGQFWANMKSGKHKRFLQQCLDKSTKLKDDYEKLLKTREENKLKPQYTVEAKVEWLIEYATQNGRYPPFKRLIKTSMWVNFWGDMKSGRHKRFLQECLDKSTDLKDDYENFLKTREENKLKPQYTVEAKVEWLIEYATQMGTSSSKRDL